MNSFLARELTVADNVCATIYIHTHVQRNGQTDSNLHTLSWLFAVVINRIKELGKAWKKHTSVDNKKQSTNEAKW